MGRTSKQASRTVRRIATLVVIAVISTSCLYVPGAVRTINSSGGDAQPWWCESKPAMGHTDCLTFSAHLDHILTIAATYPTVADAVAAGATEIDPPRAGLGVTYRLPDVPDFFVAGQPQLLLYAGNAAADRIAGLAHLVSTAPSASAPPGYTGVPDRWIDVDKQGTWLLPIWAVRGYENHPDVFAPSHPCLAAGVSLGATTDPCYLASHTDDLEVLVTNDDGIGAAGIDALVEALREVPGISLTVVAPATAQPGSGDTTTPGGVTGTPSTTASGYPGTAVDGTPADSVLYAINALGTSPDLAVSGINDSQSIGPDIALSGTVGAARTAARSGIPALATSQGESGVAPDFPAGVATTLQWVENFRLGLVGVNPLAVANLNTPTCTDGASLRGTVDTFVALGVFGRSSTAQDCASTATVINDDIDALNRGFTSLTNVGLRTPVQFVGALDVPIADSDRCEVVGHECMLPFPSNAMTVSDSTTSTGLRVALPIESLPANTSGVAIDPTRHNRNDGFSPGSAALTLFPGVDPTGSGLPPLTDIGASLLDTSASIVIDATTGERWPHWAEIDSNADDPDRQGLIVLPAKNYANGHRIVIGLRNLVDGDGAPIEPTDAFRAYRDRLWTSNPEVEARRPAMEAVFSDLSAAGIGRDELVIAWDFTVISDDSLTGPLFAMTDAAFHDLGAAAPDYTITSVVDDVSGQRRVIDGTYEIPLFLTGDGSPGNGLNLLDSSGIPTRNGTWTAPFQCQVPFLAPTTDPGPGVIYGHGLLGNRTQTTSSGPTALSRENFVVCGTDLIGMADSDVGNAITVLQEAGKFYTIADRLMQGHLNEVFLGRLLAHGDGFAADPAFAVDGRMTIDTSRTYFYGISQGGIMGPATTAVSPDIDRGVFGVPGVNYSTLLSRSVDFNTFSVISDAAYTDSLDQAILLLLSQMLWDRGEGNGYISLFADPLPGMNPKSGLLHLALGDHQVANLAADVMARSMGASVVWPAVAPGRSNDVEPFWGIDKITTYPHTGSATVMWDSGSPLPPLTNTADFTGRDPHGDPRTEPAAVEQLAHFLLTGEIIDTCGGAPCTATP